MVTEKTFLNYLKSYSKSKIEGQPINLFTDLKDFKNNWKSKQFSIIPFSVNNNARWVLIVINNQDNQVYPFFYNGLKWDGYSTTHDKEKAEAADQIKPIIGNINNTWISVDYNNYTVSEQSNNENNEDSEAYIIAVFDKVVDFIKTKPNTFKIIGGWTSNDFGKSIQPNSQEITNNKVKNLLQAEKTKAETERDTAQTSLKTWTDTFGTKKPSEIKQCTHKPEDLKPADYDQLKKDLAIAQADLKTKTDELKTTTDKITELDKIKGDLATKTSELKTANDAITSLTSEKATVQEAQKKAETDLKSWTDAFGDKKPSEVKTEYDKLKEQHTADQSEKPKPEALKLSEYDKILLLLQKHQNIQQLKEQLKDKVLLATSKAELLEKLSNYEYSMLIFQASAGEFALLWTNSEMRRSMVYYFMDDDKRKETAEKEIEAFLEPTTLMVNHVDLWHVSNPDKNPTYTGFLAIGAAEKVMSLVKKNSRLNLGDGGKDQGQFSNYFYDLGLPVDWYVQERTKLQNDLQKVYDNLAIDEEIIKQKKGPFLTYLHTRPVFSSLYKEIKKLNSNVDLLHVTDDKNEFLKNLSEHRFNLLLWEWKDGCWSVLWTQYSDKYAYYSDTDEELEFRQEEAQIRKFLKGESFKRSFYYYWGAEEGGEGKSKQGFATTAIETILKRIKDNPKLALSEDSKENELTLLEGSADKSQKEYDIYLKQLNQKDQKIEQISQIEVKS